jgi:CRP/FNR family transcriptional regulator, cyclic AMP receptor protein
LRLLGVSVPFGRLAVATRVLDRSDLIDATLRKVGLFAKWPADVAAAMAAASQLWRFAKGEAVFQAGAPPAGVFILVDGSLFVRRSWPSGKHMATTISRPGWPLCVTAAWDGIEYPYDGIARSDLHAVLIPRANFLVAVRGDPKRLEDLIHFINAQIRQDIEALHTRAIGSPRCLTAKYLAYLSRPSIHLSVEDPDAVDPTAFDVTQDELAAMLHTSRQTVNQLMKAMEREGVLKREGKHLRIVDFLKLLAIMEEDEPIHPAWREQMVAWDARLQTTDTRKLGGARGTAQTIPR